MMFINNYCTDFMFEEVIVCVTYSSSILSLIIFNFLLVFKISQQFVELYVNRFSFWNLFINFNKMNDILKTKKKLGIVRDNVVDYNVMYTMIGRIMNFMQYILININFSYFF